MGWIIAGALVGGALLSTVWSCGGACAVGVGLAGAIPGALIGGVVAALTGSLFDRD